MKKILCICAICCAVAGTIAATCILVSKSKKKGDGLEGFCDCQNDDCDCLNDCCDCDCKE